MTITSIKEMLWLAQKTLNGDRVCCGCNPAGIIALGNVAEAAREYRAANERYIAVSSRYDDVDSPEWHQASRAQLDREFDLYIALDVLAKIESCPS